MIRRSLRNNVLPRAGFTLLEMLVALALSTVVISAVYGAVHLQWKVRSSSESQVQTSKRLQGIVRDLTFDLRTCRRPSLPESTIVDSAADNDSFLKEPEFIAESDFTEKFLQLESATENLQLIDFVGRSDCILLTVASHNPRFPHRGNVSSKVAQTVWFVNSGRDRRVPFAESDTKLQHHQIVPAGAESGLTRIHLMSAGQKARRQELVTRQTSQWSVIDGTVEAIHLRYFDGATWHQEWNSHESHLLPHAVEVSIVHGEATARSTSSRTRFNQTARPPRSLVIRLPQAGGSF